MLTHFVRLTLCCTGRLGDLLVLARKIRAASRVGYNHGMKFSWDEAKRRSNLQKHGIDFIDAENVFEGPTFTYEDDHFVYVSNVS